MWFLYSHSRSSLSLYYVSIAFRWSLYLHICLLNHWRGRCHVWGALGSVAGPDSTVVWDVVSWFARLGVWRWHAVAKSSKHLQRCRVLDVGLYSNFTKIISSYFLQGLVATILTRQRIEWIPNLEVSFARYRLPCFVSTSSLPLLSRRCSMSRVRWRQPKISTHNLLHFFRQVASCTYHWLAPWDLNLKKAEPR